MTNKEAIAVLTSHLHHWKRLLESRVCTKKEGEETIEALKIAIIALREVEIFVKARKIAEELTKSIEKEE